MKTCSKCKITKSLDDFSKDSSRKDHKCLACKICNKKNGDKYSPVRTQKRFDNLDTWLKKEKENREKY